ncbi:MAG: methionine--tRNA ligase [bacterium]
MNRNKFYVTTPIYYVNSKPHLGTLYSTLIADVAARWNKLKSKKVFFLTGTDEHGQKIENKAKDEGRDPKEFVDSMIEPFKKVWHEYELDYDKFIRTTDPEHEKAVIKLIKILQHKGDVYKAPYIGYYCTHCETFVNVGSEAEKNEAGKYICPSCKREIYEVSEESYFFRLSAYEDQLLKFFKDNPNFIVPKNRLNEVISFVKEGLKDLCISRKSVKWGIPFPGDPDHTVYVWGDALTNYISAIGFGSDDKKKQEEFDFWWPADLHVLGKDILKFHAVYWPAILMAAGLQPPKQLLVHGFILMGESKMSKSLGNVMDPKVLADWYGIEPVRYYLMRQMPITQDGKFDLKDLENRISGDLANNLGNLLNRTVGLALKNGLETVETFNVWEADSASLKEKCEEAFRSFWDDMNHKNYHIALADLGNFISEVNGYFHYMQPWVLAKKNNELFKEVISATCHSLYAIGIMLWPIMPRKMEKLLQHLGYSFDLSENYEEELRKNEWNKVFVLNEVGEPLFVKPETHVEPVEKEELETEKEEIINMDDFAKIKLHVGKILECESLKDSDKLYKLQVDLGNLGKRQILAGVAQFFKPEELIGKLGTFVVNLKPRKIMGEESQGMMLVAKDEKGNMRFVTFSGEVEPGIRLS